MEHTIAEDEIQNVSQLKAMLQTEKEKRLKAEQECRTMDEILRKDRGDQLSAALVKKDEVINRIEQEVRTGMHKLMDLSREMETLRTEKIRLKENSDIAIRDLETENSKLTDDLAARDLEIAVISTSVEAYKDEKSDLEAEVRKLRCEIIASDNSFGSLVSKERGKLWDDSVVVSTNSFDDERTSLQSQVRLERNRAIESQSKLEILQNDLVTSRATINSLTSEKLDLQGQIQIQKERMTNLEKSIPAAEKAIDNMTQRIVVLSEELVRSKADERKVKNLEAELHQASEVTKGKSPEYANLTTTIEEMKSVQENLEEKLKAAQEELQVKDSRIVSLSNDLEKINVSQSNIINEANTKLLKVREVLDEKETDILQSEKIIQTLQQKILSSQSTITSLQYEKSLLQDAALSEESEASNDFKLLQEVLETRLVTAEESLKEKDMEITSLSDKLQTKVKDTAELERKLVDAQKTASEKSEKVSQSENVIQLLQNQIVSSHATISSLTSEKAHQQNKSTAQREKEEGSQSENVIKLLQNQIECAHNTISSLTAEKLMLQEKISAVEKVSGDSQQESVIDLLQKEVASSHALISSITSERSKLVEKVEDQEKQILDYIAKETLLKNQSDELIADSESKVDQIATLTAACKSLKLEQKDLESKLKETTKTLESRKNEIKILHDSKAKAIIEMEDKLSKVQDIVVEKDNLVDRSKRQIETLQIEVISSRATISSLTSEMTGLRESLEAQGKQPLASERIITPKTKINGSNNRPRKIQSELCDVIDDAQAKSKEIAVLSAACEQMKVSQKELQNKLNVANEKLKKKEMRANDAIEDAQGKSKEVSILSTACEQMKSSHKELQDKLNAANEELKKKETKATFLSSKLERFKANRAKNISELEGKLKQAQEIVVRKEEEVLQLQTENQLLKNGMRNSKGIIMTLASDNSILQEAVEKEINSMQCMEENVVSKDKDENVGLQDQPSVIHGDNVVHEKTGNAMKLLQDEIVSAHKIISSLTSEKSKLKDRVADLQKEIESNQSGGNVIELLQKEIASAHGTISSLTAEKAKLKDQLADSKKEKRSFDRKILDRGGKLPGPPGGSLRRSITEVNINGNTIDTLQNEIASAQETISSLTTSKGISQRYLLATQQGKMSQLGTTFELLQNQVESAHATITHLTSEKSQLRDQIATLKREKSSPKKSGNDLKLLQDEITSAHSIITSLTAEKKKLQNQLATAEKEAGNKSENVIAMLQNQIISAHGTISSITSEKIALQEQLKDQKKKILKTEKDLKVANESKALSAAQAKEALDIQEKLADAEESLVEKTTDIIQAENIIAALQKQLISSQTTISNLQSEKRKSQEQNNASSHMHDILLKTEDAESEDTKKANNYSFNAEYTNGFEVAFSKRGANQHDAVTSDEAKNTKITELQTTCANLVLLHDELENRLVIASEALAQKDMDLASLSFELEKLLSERENAALVKQETISTLKNSRVDTTTEINSKVTSTDGPANISEATKVTGGEPDNSQVDQNDEVLNEEEKDAKIVELSATCANLVLLHDDLENQLLVAEEALAQKDLKITSLSTELEIVLSQIETKLLIAQKTIVTKDKEIAELSADCELIDDLEDEIELTQTSISNLTKENLLLGERLESKTKKLAHLEKASAEGKSIGLKDGTILPNEPYSMNVDEAITTLSWLKDTLFSDLPKNKVAVKESNIIATRDDETDEFINRWQCESSLSHSLLSPK